MMFTNIRESYYGYHYINAFLICFCLSSSSAPNVANGFAFSTGTDTVNPDISNLITEPETAWIWNDLLDPPGATETRITYAFHPRFDSQFPDSRLKDQVRLAFQTWQDAPLTPTGTNYSYRRDSGGWDGFGDLRSIFLHELGHLLGYAHPDGAIFCCTPPLNFTWEFGPGFTEKSLLSFRDVMYSNYSSNSYNHILSHDELIGFYVAYTGGVTGSGRPRILRFEEVSFDEPADIVITTQTAESSGTWATAVPRIFDSFPMFRITHGEIRFSTNSFRPIGLRTLAQRWSYLNLRSDYRVSLVDVSTRGTNNPRPLQIFRGPFADFRTDSVGPDFKDDLKHRWSNPTRDTSFRVDFGLEQDVFDWKGRGGTARLVSDSDTITVRLPITTFIEIGLRDGSIVPTPSPELLVDPDIPVLARGLRVVGAANVQSFVSGLAVARIDDQDIGLKDLDEDLIDVLQSRNLLEEIKDFNPIFLGGQGPEDFIILFQGDEKTLPPEVLDQGNYLVLDRPDLLQGELLITVLSETEDAQVRSFAILGVPAGNPISLEEVTWGKIDETLANLNAVEIGGKKPEHTRAWLSSKLENAQKKIENKKYCAAIHKLEQFNGKLSDLVIQAKMDPIDAGSLGDQGEAIIVLIDPDCQS